MTSQNFILFEFNNQMMMEYSTKIENELLFWGWKYIYGVRSRECGEIL